ncbi:MAG: sensor histidine kinase KdpD [Acidimicrobiales bacterium]|nr:sensor histidine kinase KdpD [Acidimicrobiales bacterium]
MARGTLRIYLGAAPGVGKTYAMLNEGWRRAQRGTDVVVGYVETHGRVSTTAQIRDLEVVPRRQIEHRGARFEEMDVDAVLARRPRVVLVDELAHTNVPGSRHEKRWEDIELLLEGGIDVISTVNVQHLESLNDVVARITGVVQRETVPDQVVRAADQIELVDMSPEALRRRMAHGNIYPAERIDAALSNYFRPGNLTALRELALLWVADRVEESLQDYLADHGITEAWETRERVVVAVTGIPGGEQLVRRAARMAGRVRGELVGLHVVSADGLASRAGPELEHQRELVTELGGSYREVVGDDVAAALVDFAHAEKATQLVLGASRRSRTDELLRGALVTDVLRRAGTLDVHVISTAPPTAEVKAAVGRGGRRRTPFAPIPRRRRLAAWALIVAGLPALTAAFVPFRDDLGLGTELLVALAVVVAIAALGGLVIGAIGAVVAFLLVNWFLVEPYYTLDIADAEHLAALVVFLTVGGLVSLLVDRAARRSREALRARAEAEALARSTGSLVGEVDPLPVLLAQLRATFELQAAAVLARDDGDWLVQAANGEPVPTDPSAGTALSLGRDGDDVLVVTGAGLDADDLRVLHTFTDQLTVALEARRLHEEAATAVALAEADALRTALLQAVSHDLRTPLASIKASVTSLRQGDVAWTDEDRSAFLATIDEEADRLNRLVGNLLDMSRLQSGALQADLRPTALEDVVAAALGSLSGLPDVVDVEVPETLPLVVADPTLLERTIANVVANAVRFTPEGRRVRVEAGGVGDRVDLQVIDRGPGIPPGHRDAVFAPFQRLGDRPNGTGVGLGLAIARGFVTGMGGQLTLDDTPGGGLTVTIGLPKVEM